MELKMPKKSASELFQCGDVVTVNNTPYLIQEVKAIGVPTKYIAKSFNGLGGATGFHNSLELLQQSLVNNDAEHYSQKDYKLELVKK